MTEAIDDDPMLNVLEILYETRSRLRVNEMIAGQLLMRLAMMTQKPTAFADDVMNNVERDLKFVATKVEPDDSYSAAELEASLDYLGQLRVVFDNAIESTGVQFQ